jgi:hypothetical protein
LKTDFWAVSGAYLSQGSGTTWRDTAVNRDIIVNSRKYNSATLQAINGCLEISLILRAINAWLEIRLKRTSGCFELVTDDRGITPKDKLRLLTDIFLDITLAVG